LQKINKDSLNNAAIELFREKQFTYRPLFHDLLSAPMFHHSVWSVITAHKLTPVKRDVNTFVSDQRSRFTVAKHRRQK